MIVIDDILFNLTNEGEEIDDETYIIDWIPYMYSDIMIIVKYIQLGHCLFLQ